jgi:hypothetical protein
MGCVLLVSATLAWDLPKDCRNQTVVEDGGKLPTMSYHIHYAAGNLFHFGDMKTFYEAFVAKFADKFPSTKTCPMGPNYGSYSSSIFPSKTMCSLEGPLEFEIAAGVDLQGNPWGLLYQRAFFIPIEFIDEAWTWSKANRGKLDVVKHPNTGCMSDDHLRRPVWEGTAHKIYTLQFPCNMAATGCLDSKYPGYSCGCDAARKSDAPGDSCKNCVVIGTLPPEPNTTLALV